MELPSGMDILQLVLQYPVFTTVSASKHNMKPSANALVFQYMTYPYATILGTIIHLNAQFEFLPGAIKIAQRVDTEVLIQIRQENKSDQVEGDFIFTEKVSPIQLWDSEWPNATVKCEAFGWGLIANEYDVEKMLATETLRKADINALHAIDGNCPCFPEEAQPKDRKFFQKFPCDIVLAGT